MPDITQKDQHAQRVIEHYDHLAGNGPYGTLAPHNHGGRKSRYVAEVFDVALLEPLRRGAPHERILDFGCGTGIFTRHAAQLGEEVVGTDISPGMLEQAADVCRDCHNVRLMETDGKSLDLPDDSVDVVTTREVLCYVPDEDLPRVLNELLRVTRPGGRFLWLEQASDAPHFQRHPAAPNLVKRSPAAIRHMARKSSWELLDERVVRTPRFPWIYPVWFGLLPQRLNPTLARWEVHVHARLHRYHNPRRWWNALFELRKPDHE